MSDAFSYPRRPLEGALSAAGEVERLARAAVRHLRSGGAAQAMHGRRGAAGRAADAAPAAHQPTGAPVLYLPAVAWGYRCQRPQHLARALARAGHPVLYVDGFLRSRILPSRKLLDVQGLLHILRLRVPGRPDPYREPLQRRAAVRLADVLLAGLRHEKPLMVLVQLPFWTELGRELARRLSIPLVYDRIDLHAGFPGVPSAIAAVEEELIQQADLVCATSAALAELPAAARRVLRLPNGVELQAFPEPGPQRPTPGEPRIGYVGALGAWFDAGAVREAARSLPDWRFRLAGRVEDAAVAGLAQLANVELIGEIPFTDVPRFLAGLDAALVPFRNLPLTRAVDPVKLYEALAVGLPVVARRLPETARWSEPLVYLYDDPADFVRQLRRALAETSAALARERRRTAEGESWDHRAAALLQAVGVTMRTP